MGASGGEAKAWESMVWALIEVADSSVERDRLKAAIYSSAEVEDYWILNLVDRRLERFTKPSAEGYQVTITSAHDELVELNLRDQILRLELASLLN